MRDYDKRNEALIKVDENDRPLGFVRRWEAHTGQGVKHRAFQVLVFNKKGQLLLAKRNPRKLFGGFWDCTVSSHPLKGEDYEISIRREVEEEIGVPDAQAERIGELVYQASDGNGMAENEYCALFKIVTDHEITSDPEEVSEIKWMSLEELKGDIKSNRKTYAPWFVLSMEKYFAK